MSDLLVYVNEAVSCSVIFDNSEVTLEEFRHEILDTQVDDVLAFPYKFTRTVNMKRVVVGLKQEKILKLKQCLEESDEGQGAVHLVREEMLTKNAEQPKVQEPSLPSTSQDDEPYKKKAKVSRQPTLMDMFSPNRLSVSSEPYSAARARKVKIFSAEEIEDSQGLKKTYRQFWNNKAEELCKISALRTFKPGEIQGAINVAWIIKKTEYLKDELEEIDKKINDKCPVDILRKFQLSAKTLEKNRERVETASTSLRDLQQELTRARQEYIDSSKSNRQAASVKVDKLENDLQSQLTEMRKAQDALRKAIDTRRRLLNQLHTTQQSDNEEVSDDSADGE